MDQTSRQPEAAHPDCESDDARTAVSRSLDCGRRVRIRAGELIGLEGTVVELRPNDRCYIAVQFLHEGIHVELPVDSIEALDESATSP